MRLPLRAWKNTLTSLGLKPKPRSCKPKGRGRISTLEQLECRTMRTVNSAFTSEFGLLATAGDGDNDTITITAQSSDGSVWVKVNGADPDGTPVLASDVIAISAWGGAGNDTIDLSAVSAADFPNLTGTWLVGEDGDDTIHGSQIADNIDGDYIMWGMGNDHLYGNGGNDTIYGGGEVEYGGDYLYGGEGEDHLYGDDSYGGVAAYGGDYLYGGEGADILEGQAGNDFMQGNAGDDQSYGGIGGDTFVFDNTDSGHDALFGNGAISFAEVGSGVTFDLGNASEQEPVAGTLWVTLSSDSAFNILFGSAYDDTLIGNGNANYMLGGDGDDIMSGGAGADGIYGGNGNDRLAGDAGNDTLYGDYYASGGGNDTYVFDPATGASGNLGTDIISEIADSDSDTLDFSAFSSSVTVNISSTIIGGQTVHSGVLVLYLSTSTGIENVIGGSAGNTITGNARDNVLLGGAGVDTISAGDGNDILTGGLGSDYLTGGAGDDAYVFDSSGNLGTDTITETAADAGSDTLNFSLFAHNIGTSMTPFNLGTSGTNQTVFTGALVLNLSDSAGIENVLGGTGDDKITGNSRPNILDGGDGADSLSGGDGDDVLFGRADVDVLSGNAGVDTILGGDGNDELYGGSGNDLLFGDAGEDQLYGERTNCMGNRTMISFKVARTMTCFMAEPETTAMFTNGIPGTRAWEATRFKK